MVRIEGERLQRKKRGGGGRPDYAFSRYVPTTVPSATASARSNRGMRALSELAARPLRSRDDVLVGDTPGDVAGDRRLVGERGDLAPGGLNGLDPNSLLVGEVGRRGLFRGEDGDISAVSMGAMGMGQRSS